MMAGLAAVCQVVTIGHSTVCCACTPPAPCNPPGHPIGVLLGGACALCLRLQEGHSAAALLVAQKPNLPSQCPVCCLARSSQYLHLQEPNSPAVAWRLGVREDSTAASPLPKHRPQVPSSHSTSQEPNPSAVARLLRFTDLTKSRFLDHKFLRRQQKAGGAAARGSRLWYLPVDTWMESTVAQAGSAAAAAAGGKAGGAGGGQAAVAFDPNKFSVPVDDVQARSQGSMWAGSLPLDIPLPALRQVLPTALHRVAAHQCLNLVSI